MHIAENIVDSKSSPVFSQRRKLSEADQSVLWNLFNIHPTLPSISVIEEAHLLSCQIQISVRHLNRIRQDWGFERIQGRPVGSKNSPDRKDKVVKVESQLLSVGVHLFSEWMESGDEFPKVLSLLNHAREEWVTEHTDEYFPLLNHKDETLLLRFKALFYAPLIGIGKLTEFDYQEHCLSTLIGRTYKSSTLTQYTGELERIHAGQTLVNILFESCPGKICYIDGHMIPFWTTVSMHKGKITMLGRIMAGSQAVVAHNENGRAIYVEYQPPDIRLPVMITDYCEHIVVNSGIDIFVIDREINSGAIASEFERRGWGLLSMLDSNQYKELSDWDYEFVGEIEGSGSIYSGQWSDQKRRSDDPRHFVVLETKDQRLLPYWGTSKVKDTINPLDWPSTYAERTEIQENSFKRMKSHGSLEINYGVKKIFGEDRHQKRAQDKLEDSRMSIDNKVRKKEAEITTQLEKIKESEDNGHTTRLVQRQNHLVVINDDMKKITSKAEKINDQIEKIGEPRQRADRDFRKQLIMTVRTLILENCLMKFWNILTKEARINMGMDSLIELLFNRTGAYIETSSRIVYWVNTKGLSVPYREKINNLAYAFNAMEVNRQGKPVELKIRAAPA
jgi:hypothetical protein